MADFAAGYEAARTAAAIAERSDRGAVSLRGSDRIQLLHKLSTQEVRELTPPQGSTTVLTTHKGRIVDLMTVLARDEDLLLLTSPGRGGEVTAWLDKYVLREDVTPVDISSDMFQLALLGPTGGDLARDVLALGASRLPAWHWVGTAEGLLAYRGECYLDEPSFNVLGPLALHGEVIARLEQAGAVPLAPDLYEAIRIESGIPGAPGELSEERNPWEVRLDASISLVKGCYIGQEVVARLDTYKKVHRALVKLELAGAVDWPRPEKLRIVHDGRKVGYVSSLARHPATGITLGLGFMTGDLVNSGLEVTIADTTARIEPVVPWGKAQGAE